ncbi:MAG: glutamate synthase [Planctomycetota bacterium]|nr:glutamate synthase [Planctomycetota bacterium]MDA1137747.1 glutamate synthase [Planctomycetota bacterium]
MGTIDCRDKTTREINRAIKALIKEGAHEITLQKPMGKHNLAVALLEPVSVKFEGSVGYYCAGLMDGADVDIKGSAGWGVGESMMNGNLVVRGNAGNGAGAAMRGGTVVVHGNAAARAGVSMKGGVLLITGDCGYMTGFMAQKGNIIVCGNAGEGFADSMYATVCFVGGEPGELGTDAVVEDLNDEDLAFLKNALETKVNGDAPDALAFKKIVAGRKLWNFDKQDWATWRNAL